MATQKNIIDLAIEIDTGITAQVKGMALETPSCLPDVDHTLTKDCVRKIEGTYNVSGAKTDIDNAIDLLYIAYNATPQEKGDIRAGIDGLMASMIDAQQDSGIAMNMAVFESDRIIELLNGSFKYWKEVNASTNSQTLKEFVGGELVFLAGNIKTRSERVSKTLEKILDTYDIIISETATNTNKSEMVLGDKLEDKTRINEEMVKSEAARKKVESLIESIQIEITKYAQKAKEYNAQAVTEEERERTVSTIKGILALILTVATGFVFGGLAAIGTLVALSGSTSNTGQQTSRPDKSSSAPARRVEVINAINSKKNDNRVYRERKTALEKENERLKEDQKRIEADKSPEKATINASELEQISKLVANNENEIKDIDLKILRVTAEESTLNAELASLDSSLEQATGNLREMEREMLTRMVEYEKEKRKQDDELAKISILLCGQESKEKTIELALKSLCLSITALKRMREIVFEIKFFFDSFVSFMEGIMEEAKDQSNAFLYYMSDDDESQDALNNLRVMVNSFFILQTSQWRAVKMVSFQIEEGFKDGGTKLQGLAEKYLTGEDLTKYLEGAAKQIDQIVAQRKAAADENIRALEEYRNQIGEKDNWRAVDFKDATPVIGAEPVAPASKAELVVAAIIYEHANYDGKSQELTLGSYNMDDIKIGNDQLSSLKVTQGYKVTLFEHHNFLGRSKTFTKDSPWVGDDFNDITSAIKVEKV